MASAPWVKSAASLLAQYHRFSVRVGYRIVCVGVENTGQLSLDYLADLSTSLRNPSPIFDVRASRTSRRLPIKPNDRSRVEAAHLPHPFFCRIRVIKANLPTLSQGGDAHPRLPHDRDVSDSRFDHHVL